LNEALFFYDEHGEKRTATAEPAARTNKAYRAAAGA
jgi:hypothetical protein